jgi:DNA transposition AAA+ family ATPase
LATGRVNDSFSSLEKADEKIVNTAETEPVFTVTDAADDRERAVIADGLAGYNYTRSATEIIARSRSWWRTLTRPSRNHTV